MIIFALLNRRLTRNMQLKYILTLTCLLLNGAMGFAQIESPSTSNSINYSLSAADLYSKYNQAVIDSFNYIDGKEQKLYFNITKSNPLLNNQLGEGTLFIDGIEYKNLIIAYDIYNDEVLNIPTTDELRFYYVRLKKEKIDSFYIRFEDEEYHFYQLNFAAGSREGLSNGFYEIRKLQKSHMLFNYTTIVNKQEGYDEYKFDLKQYYFSNSDYYSLNSKKKLYDLFPEKKKLIKKKLAKMPVPYRQLDKYQLIEIMNYVESI